jgi:integrase
MKQQFKLYRRSNGRYYAENTTTGKQSSLGTATRPKPIGSCTPGTKRPTSPRSTNKWPRLTWRLVIPAPTRAPGRMSWHSYRYAWAERARQAGFPERFAHEALGHSAAVHRAYAKGAKVSIPSLEEYEKQATAGTPEPTTPSAPQSNVIPFPTPTTTATATVTTPSEPAALPAAQILEAV